MNSNKVIFLRYNNELNSASFNRYLSVIKAVRVNQPVCCISIRPSVYSMEESEMFNKLGVDTFYPITFQNKPSKKIIIKIIDIIRCYKNINLYLLKNEIEKGSILFLYSTNLFDFILSYFLKKKFDLKLVTERNEYPLSIRSKTGKIKRWLISTTLWSYKLFDGIVLMTEPLIRFYSRYLRKNVVVVKIPMTVDVDRFKDIKKNEKTVDYICYVGSLLQNKDGVDNLIYAFQKICNKYPDMRLKIVGGTEKEVEEKMKITGKALSNIDFYGMVSRDAIPEILVNAKLLVLPRPDSKQAEGGFPTKLGEYLITGNPVIVTPVGEIPQYLKDREHVVFCEPDNVDDLFDKIVLIIKDYKKYKYMRINAIKKVEDCFSISAQQSKLSDFFAKLNR